MEQARLHMFWRTDIILAYVVTAPLADSYGDFVCFVLWFFFFKQQNHWSKQQQKHDFLYSQNPITSKAGRILGFEIKPEVFMVCLLKRMLPCTSSGTLARNEEPHVPYAHLRWKTHCVPAVTAHSFSMENLIDYRTRFWWTETEHASQSRPLQSVSCKMNKP